MFDFEKILTRVTAGVETHLHILNRIACALEKLADRDRCFAVYATGVANREVDCVLPYGHEGSHRGVFRVEDKSYRYEWGN